MNNLILFSKIQFCVQFLPLATSSYHFEPNQTCSLRSVIIMPDSFSCITCQVLFKSPELQREHYKSDWHRYNLKRKVSAIPSVTLEEFEVRVRNHRDQAQNENRDDSHYCKCCSKLFNTTNAYNNHLNSKKHKLAQERANKVEDEEHSSPSDTDSFVKVDVASATEPGASKPAEDKTKFTLVNAHGSGDEDADTESDIEEVDSSELMTQFIYTSLWFY